MREIPIEVAALLKSRSMIGTNKPTHEVTVDGLSGSYDLPETWVWFIQGIEAVKKNISNWIATNDGKYMCCWFDSATKQLQTGFSSDADFLNTNYAIENVVTTSTVTVATVYENQCSLFKRNDGKVLLMVVDVGASASAKCYISNTGNGNDWVLYSTVYTTADGSKSILGIYASIPVVTSTGRIVYSLHCGKYQSGYIFSVASVAYSDDNGLTWTIKYLSNISGTEAVGQICILADNTMFFSYIYGGGKTFVYKSTDNGSNWTEVVAFSSNFSDALRYEVYGLSFYYDDLTNSVYAICQGTYNGCGIYVLENANSTDFINASKWKFIYNINENNNICGRIYIINNALVFNNTSADSILGLKAKSVSLPIKSISISRNKNMAGSLNLAVDNKNGEWSPDNTENQNVLFPNTEIVVKQGYGEELTNTFTGMIDRIEMSTFPQELKLSVRDKLKLALDQTIAPQVITYTSQTVEDIFADLAGKAGMTAGTIETTGLTLAEKTFSWETYADCFSWLADLVGFEFGCDEDGKVYFKKDAIPQATDWILTFTDGTAQAYFPIVENSDVLKSSDGETTYVKDTDYTIDYDTGELTSITIADGETKLTYVFAVYSFKEGEDIISLGYTIDDNDIYSKVIVYGKDSNDEVISAYKDYVSKDYYNVLSQKIMKIDVSEASTVEQLQAIADRAEMLMRSRVRTVRFAAVAVPWLQVGDLIQVVESSTTISELYRVTDLSTNMDSDGYTMQITCYHHSA